MSSNNSSLANQLRHVPTGGKLKADHQIELVDHTKDASELAGAAQRQHSGASSGEDAPFKQPLRKRLTSNSLAVKTEARRQLNKRKYAKYQHGHPSTSAPPPDDEAAEQIEEGEEAAPTQTSRLERARAKAFRNRNRAFIRAAENDTVLDILYENQRGAFLFGVPVFSASSLLNFDPRPWQNAQLRTSPVDIRNAQVPDPSWEWAWKSWYVDMSRDVDEEGWEYSFSFQRGFAWHGNHPWFHSFVRRRRWLRKRVRKDRERKTSERAHELTSDYFTIHPRSLKEIPHPESRASSAYLGTVAAGTSSKQHPDTVDEHPDIERPDITDIASLMQHLRHAAVDREKLVLIYNFLASGSEELYYLSTQMPQIMNLFVFQSSRRHLLASLMSNYDTQTQRKEDLDTHSHPSNESDTQTAHNAAAKQAENLLAAVKAADDQVKRLEYWSDIKGMTQQHQTLGAKDSAEQSTEHGWSHSRWAALEPASTEPHDQAPFISKQRPSQPAAVPRRHAEHYGSALRGKGSKGKGRAWSGENLAPGRQGVTFYEDARESLRESDSTGFTTAAESVRGMEGKGVKARGRGQGRGFDGVDEEGERGIGEEDGEEGFSERERDRRDMAPAGDLDPSGVAIVVAGARAGDGDGGGEGTPVFSSPSESGGLRRYVTPPETTLDAAIQAEGEKREEKREENKEEGLSGTGSSPTSKRLSASELQEAVPEPVEEERGI